MSYFYALYDLKKKTCELVKIHSCELFLEKKVKSDTPFLHYGCIWCKIEYENGLR